MVADWDHLDRERQWQIVEQVIEEENPDTLHAFLTGDCGLDEDRAAAVAKAPLPEGHGRLGATATARILDELRKEVITYDKAVERCGWHHSDHRTGEILERLPTLQQLVVVPYSNTQARAADFQTPARVTRSASSTVWLMRRNPRPRTDARCSGRVPIRLRNCVTLMVLP